MSKAIQKLHHFEENNKNVISLEKMIIKNNNYDISLEKMIIRDNKNDISLEKMITFLYLHALLPVQICIRASENDKLDIFQVPNVKFTLTSKLLIDEEVMAAFFSLVVSQVYLTQFF